MKKMHVFSEVERTKVIAILRAESADSLVGTINALVAGGITVVEVSMTTPGAIDVIAEAARQMGSRAVLGAGTVLDAETARTVILAGASFIVSPVLTPSVVEMGHRYGCAVYPGVFTPTEAQAAQELGCNAVKLFPAMPLGPNYIKSVVAPLPHLNIVAVGGVTLENALEFLNAGAIAVGVGSSLVEKAWVRDQAFDKIKARALTWVNTLS